MCTCFLRFRSDASVGKIRFAVNWTTVEPGNFIYLHTVCMEGSLNILCILVCSARQTETNGIIRSPGYPNSYPVNEHCQSFISTEHGKHFKIEISRVTFDNPN